MNHYYVLRACTQKTVKETGKQMHGTSRFQRLHMAHHNGVPVLGLEEMDIWDGTDLSLIRDRLIRMINSENCRSVGIDLQMVQYVPTGFFGMLYAWHQFGVAIRLYRPHDRIQEMLWFRHFFGLEKDGSFLLANKPPLDFIEDSELDVFEPAEVYSPVP
jgi:hypothetical protein